MFFKIFQINFSLSLSISCTIFGFQPTACVFSDHSVLCVCFHSLCISLLLYTTYSQKRGTGSPLVILEQGMERIIGFYFPMGLIIYVLVWRGGSKNINSKHKYVKANILLLLLLNIWLKLSTTSYCCRQIFTPELFQTLISKQYHLF